MADDTRPDGDPPTPEAVAGAVPSEEVPSGAAASGEPASSRSSGSDAAADEQPQARPPDPWKGLRGVMAGTLILEAIVAGLALPVIAKLGGGISTGGGVVVIVLAVAMIVAAFLLRTGWGLPLALVLQVVMIACGLFQFTLGVLGVMFALIWGYILYLRRDLMKHLERGSGKYLPPDGN